MFQQEENGVSNSEENGVLIPFEGFGRETTIYRYLPLERYYEMIEDHVNVLSHITLWEDPYEAFVFRAGLTLPGAENLDVYDKFKGVYGQSWTMHETESDVIWRAMGKRGSTVRIRTTVEKLIASLRLKRETEDRVRVGRVVYKDEDEFSSRLIEADLRAVLEGDLVEAMNFFFVKRSEFALEKEVRVIAIPNENDIDRTKCKKGHLLKFGITPADMIDEVMADPAMDRRVYEQLVCRTLYAGIVRSKIKQSKLFTWPKVSPSNLVGNGAQDESGLPNEAAFCGYLDGKGVAPGNRKSIVSRVKRIFRMKPEIKDHLTREELEGVIAEMPSIISNPGSARDCKTALRHYIGMLFPGSEQQQCVK